MTQFVKQHNIAHSHTDSILQKHQQTKVSDIQEHSETYATNVHSI